ncbi:FecR domain-containing protein [Chitinophagaceae bacterium 26-R-25]|nr:FecR domain-containing protein [Chitinophagaceae bacterium 26-R-25]
MEFKAFIDKLKRYRNNQSSELEAVEVELWYESFDSKKINEATADERKTEAIKNNIRAGIESHIQKEKAIRARVITVRFMRVAAMLIIVVGAALFLFHNTRLKNTATAATFCEIRTKAAEMKQIVLPDHSHIWINSSSVVRYDSVTFTNNRNIYLDEGEAFFDVAKDEKHPFTVIAAKISTRVLGTSFNVRSYKNLAYASVDVKTGKVEVSNNTINNKVLLTANQEVALDTASGEFAMVFKGSDEIAGWIKGKYFLKDVSFAELNLFFQNQYGVKLVSNNEEVAHAHYTINIIEGSSLSKTIELICNIHNNKYRRLNNEITLY